MIENKDINAGFVALIVFALNGVRRALKQNALPVITFGAKDTPFFYDSNKGPNVWEYYFEQISPFSYDTFKKWVADGSISQDQIHVNTYDEVMDGHMKDPDRLATFWAWEEPDDKAVWMAEKRAIGRQFVKNHLVVKSELRNITDQFFQQNFDQEYLIGIHARGTDFGYADPLPLSRFYESIDQLTRQQKNRDYKIFLATDQTQFVQEFQEKYPGLVVTTNAMRSANHIAPFKKSGGSSFQKGADVMIDMMLLAKCDYIMKGAAAVGEFALWLTDEDQKFTDFSTESEFKSVKYHGIKSAYLTLNIKNKSKLGLLIQDHWETFNRFFFYVSFTRAIYKRFRWVRNIFKH